MSRWKDRVCRLSGVTFVSEKEFSRIYEMSDTRIIDVPKSVEVSFESGELTLSHWWVKHTRLRIPRQAGNPPKGISTNLTVKKHEKDTARLLASRGHAHARPGSGSHPLGKGDAVGKQDLGECKQTEKKSISIKQAWLAKIEEEARGEGKMPFLHLRWLKLYDYADVMALSRDWVMIPAHWFRELLESYEAPE